MAVIRYTDMHVFSVFFSYCGCSEAWVDSVGGDRGVCSGVLPVVIRTLWLVYIYGDME
jgi:hypothetical protein